LSVNKDVTVNDKNGIFERCIHYSWGGNFAVATQEFVFERVEEVPGKIEAWGATGNVIVTGANGDNKATVRGMRENRGEGKVTLTYRL